MWLKLDVPAAGGVGFAVVEFGDSGQAVGIGCVYPSNVMTLADQLSAKHVRWAGYMNQMGATRGREQKRCGGRAAGPRP